MYKFILTWILFLGVAFSVQAQEIVEVTGVVVDSNNEPLIGVSIFVTDAPGLGTITNNKGQYKIQVERYKKLTISYIGFEQQEILVKDDLIINVVLEEADLSVLNEVVVTGTGVQTRLT